MKPKYSYGLPIFTAFTAMAMVLLLAAIAYPIFRMDYDNKQRSECASRLRMLAMAVQQYAVDNEGLCPPAGGPDSNWAMGLYPYIPSTEVLQCPAAGIDYGDSILLSNRAVDYYLNAQLHKRKIGLVKNPDTTFMFGEGEPASGNYACFSVSTCVGQSDYGPVGMVSAGEMNRHMNGANYAFVDGHIKWIPTKSFQQKANEPGQYGFAVR